MSGQKNRHQKLDGFWVTNSVGDNSIYTAEPSDPVIEIK